MSKRVTVIVEGREYIVEVGNLDEAPIKATADQKPALSHFTFIFYPPRNCLYTI